MPAPSPAFRSATPDRSSLSTAIALGAAAAALGAFLGASVTFAADTADGKRIAAAPAKTSPADARQIERGRYLVKVAGCNDCHTPHYPEKAGAIPEKDWLVGAPVGFQGPWGTTYASNLRTALASMTEAEWIARARQPMRPPMPWFALRDMTDADLRAVHAYVKSLGTAGGAAPAYVPPGGKVDTPFIVFVPQNLPPAAPGSAAAK
jgi:mono/diheme cytochrome c family protein